MPSNTFAFKQFTVKQDKCAMKVGTDAVLLGSWVTPEGAASILDIGTGTGVIALMLAQRSKAVIDAIDIDPNACVQAKENVSVSPWSARVNILHESFQTYSLRSEKKYDLIVSNPPFFVDSSKASGLERTISRHTDLLPYNELIEGILRLLKPDGRFCVILPSKEGELFRDMTAQKQLNLCKLTRVRTRADKATEKRLLMQFERKPSSFSENTLVIEKDERHSYTDEYKELTKEYYLGF
jgi:tRNA1Val (adenine37-N6)-methyltransferase